MQCPSFKDFYEHVNMGIVCMLSKEEQLASRLQCVKRRKCLTWLWNSCVPVVRVICAQVNFHLLYSYRYLRIIIVSFGFTFLGFEFGMLGMSTSMLYENLTGGIWPTRFSVLWFSLEFFRLCAWIRCNGILSSEIARQFEELTESQELRQTFIFNEYKCTFLH